MPALIGGFGKINMNTIKINNTKSDINKRDVSKVIPEVRYKMGSYLAGLIEANGSFAVHNKDSKTETYVPKILVVFSIKQESLVRYLARITGAGTVYSRKNANCIIWQIQEIKDVFNIINRINGYMRTPKIEALHRAIHWFNKSYIININCLGLDLSAIDSNAWLAGFTEGAGNFSITLNEKKKGNITTKRIQTFFRIKLKQNYHRDASLEQIETSYFVILSKIARYLDVNLYSRTREKKDKVFYAFMIVSYNSTSHKKIINYFNNFPLYKTKHGVYEDWSNVVKKTILEADKVLTEQDILDVKKIKAKFNSLQ